MLFHSRLILTAASLSLSLFSFIHVGSSVLYPLLSIYTLFPGDPSHSHTLVPLARDLQLNLYSKLWPHIAPSLPTCSTSRWCWYLRLDMSKAEVILSSPQCMVSSVLLSCHQAFFSLLGLNFRLMLDHFHLPSSHTISPQFHPFCEPSLLHANPFLSPPPQSVLFLSFLPGMF